MANCQSICVAAWLLQPITGTRWSFLISDPRFSACIRGSSLHWVTSY